jgi:hypothetical protein
MILAPSTSPRNGQRQAQWLCLWENDALVHLASARCISTFNTPLQNTTRTVLLSSDGNSLPHADPQLTDDQSPYRPSRLTYTISVRTVAMDYGNDIAVRGHDLGERDAISDDQSA